jgi:cAMP phosphodiesterase
MVKVQEICLYQTVSNRIKPYQTVSNRINHIKPYINQYQTERKTPVTFLRQYKKLRGPLAMRIQLSV